MNINESKTIKVPNNESALKDDSYYINDITIKYLIKNL